LTKTQGEILVEIEGATPKDVNGWKGISGSAIFTEDGYLVGVIIQGPKCLAGGQLEGIALDRVIEKDPGFSRCIEKYFHQEIRCLDTDKIEAREIFKLELELEALKVKKIKSNANYEMQIEEVKDRLSNRNQNSAYIESRSALPEDRLLNLLSQIDSEGKIFWEAWQHFLARQVTMDNISVKQAYGILWNLKDSEYMINFLSKLYALLKQNHQREYAEQVAQLTKAICGKAPTESVGFPAQASTSEETLLVRIKSISRPKDSLAKYMMTIWLIRNRRVYQERFRTSETPSVHQEG